MEGGESPWRDAEGDTAKPPHAIVMATEMLFYVQHYLAQSSMAALLLLVVYEYTQSVKLSFVFYLLLVGQTICMVQIGRVVHCAVQPLVQFDVTPLIAQSRRDRRTWTDEERARWSETMQWQNENAELLLLLQKTVVAALWLFVIIACLMSAEMTALWGNDDYSWIIPLYVIGGIRLFNSVVCVSMPIMEISSWLLAISFLVIYNIKKANYSTVSWSWTSIPLYVLLGAWTVFTGYTLAEYLLGIVALRTRQVEALGLYLLSFILLLSCIGTFDSEMAAGADTHGASSLLLFFGVGLLFLGMHISTMEALDTLVKRSGAFRPLPLTQEGGGTTGNWSVDEEKMARYSILIGEYDLRGASGNASGSGGHRGENESCLLTHGLIFFRTLDKVLLLGGIDCLGCVDESKDRRAKSACNCCNGVIRDACCSCVCCGGGLELLDQRHFDESAPMLGGDSSEA